MGYRCLDCGAKFKHVNDGRCPACQSAKISCPKGKKAEKVERFKRTKMFILVGAWVAFGFELFRILSK